ncbi:MAG: FAD-binding oxidoreductase, partial [Thermomicrobiales bacterium]
DARAVYNAMIDKRPGVVIQCQDANDVIAGVNLGRQQGLPVAIRGGGHNAAGLGPCDDGVVLDLGRMNGVRVDPNTGRVRVGGGAVWGDVDHATQPFGLAVPAGVISTTGVGGLTLGGGFGYLSRAYGLTCDNLLSADVVTADGKVELADNDHNPDLFWALRGGGGNFGAVTSFEFQGRPVNMIRGGLLAYTIDKADALMRLYREFIVDAPRELGLFFGYTMAPPAPFVPEAFHFQPIAKIIFCYNGDEETAKKLVAPFYEIGVALDLTGTMPIASLNSMFDALFPAGMHDYWKADYDIEVSDAAIKVHLDHGPKVPNPNSLMHLYSTNGAVQDVDSAATAYSYRESTFNHVILSFDSDAEKMPSNIEWVRNYWDALRPHSAGGAYVNFMMDEGGDRVQATYRDNYPRLQQIKAEYDPQNVFRINQNIQPKA